MVTKVVMPKLSLTMKEGTVGKWYKKEGDMVEKNEPIVEIVSEKATYDLESPATGTIRKILVEEGLSALVNDPLALITGPNEVITDNETKPSLEKPEQDSRILASPAAKRLARERNIDLSLVRGTGPEGRISEDDVKALDSKCEEQEIHILETLPLSGFRKTSAERVSLSFRTAPHSAIMMEVDALAAKTLHEQQGISYTSMLAAAVVKALHEHRMLNSSFDSNHIKIFDDVNIGIAVATDNGLVVPVIHKADRLSLPQIEQEITQLMDKARKGTLSGKDVSNGTFTITNLGMFDVDFFTPIINPPEAAILGAGKISERPVVEDGKIAIRPSIILTLSYDHRIVDGVPAALFLKRVKMLFEKAELLRE